MPLFRPLQEITLGDLPEAGGKAARLGEALRLGAPVLPGVVLSTELYRRFMRQGGLQGEIASILNTMQPKTITHFQAAEWAIRSAFRVRRTPSEVREAILEAWRSLGVESVAVRSSATNEDSPEQSFVGQHATHLDVDSDDAAIDAVLDCWASLYSAKALAYAQCFGVDLLSSSMAILMQPRIEPTSQGALFTADPITGNPDLLVLEIQEGPDAGVYSLDPYERQPGERRVWSQLRHLGLVLDEHHLAYQALEWAITAQDELYLLRVRPLTKTPAYLPQSSTDIGAGLAPLELVIPDDKSHRALQPFAWYHRSRNPGMNAAYFQHVHRLFTPYSAREDFFLSGYLYTRWHRFSLSPFQAELPRTRHLAFGLQRLYAARTLDQEYVALLREKRPELARLNRQEISTLDDGELAEHLRRVIAIGDEFWAQCGRLGYSQQVLGDLLCEIHKAWLPEEDIPDCELLLWSEREGQSQIADRLYELAKMEEAERQDAFETFFLAYRHLFLSSDDPLALSQDICSLRESREQAQAALRDWVNRMQDTEQTASPATQREQRLERRNAAERRVLNKLGRIRRTIYRHILHLARRYASMCGGRDEPVRLARLLERDIVFEVGRRLHAEGLVSTPADACLLGFQEMVNWLSRQMQRDELVRLMLERKDLRRRWWRYSPPDVMKGEDGSAGVEIAMEASPEDILRGRAVSPGIARGRARVLNTLAESTNILPGEVLVCQEPLFELSPLFSIVAAVVAEQGQLLDHASVLAREYSVPAVFSVQDATQVIQNGEELHVDANNGIIVRQRILPEWEVF